MARGPYYAAGKYWGKVTAHQLGTSSKGTPQLVISFTVVGKVDPTNPDGALLPCGESYERSIFRTLTEKTIDWTVDDLRALGFSGDRISQLDANGDGGESLVGAEHAFECKHDTYEGVVREKWTVAGSGGGIKMEPLDSRGLRQLDALFGKALKTAKAAGVAPAAPTDATVQNAPTLADRQQAANRERSAAKPAAETVADVQTDEDIPF